MLKLLPVKFDYFFHTKPSKSILKQVLTFFQMFKFYCDVSLYQPQTYVSE